MCSCVFLCLSTLKRDFWAFWQSCVSPIPIKSPRTKPEVEVFQNSYVTLFDARFLEKASICLLRLYNRGVAGCEERAQQVHARIPDLTGHSSVDMCFGLFPFLGLSHELDVS